MVRNTIGLVVKEKNYSASSSNPNWEKEKEVYKNLVLNPDHSIIVILLDAPAAGKINIPEVELVE